MMIVLFLVCFVRSGVAKLQSGVVYLGGNTEAIKWQYVTKFAYGIGAGEYSIRLKTESPSLENDEEVSMELHLDDEWAGTLMETEVCQRRSRARKTDRVKLPAGGTWSAWSRGIITQSVRSHVWYFVLSGCGQENGSMTAMNTTRRINFEFRALQPDGSELSVEQTHMPTLCFLALLVFTAFIVWYVKLCVKYARSADSLHPVIQALTVALVLQYVALALHVAHLFAYSSNGVGLRVADVISEILAVVSQVTLTSIFLLVGLGYTLLQSKMGQLEVMVPFVLLVSVLHALAVGLGKIQDDDASTKFHANEGVVGWILVFVRLAFYAWFLWAVNNTWQAAGPKLRFFLRKFQLGGSLYLLGYPVVYVITSLFAPYLRHRVLTAGMYATQTATNLWLTRLFLSRGDYFDVSTLKCSFLPGGSRPGLDKAE